MLRYAQPSQFYTYPIQNIEIPDKSCVDINESR